MGVGGAAAALLSELSLPHAGVQDVKASKKVR